MKLNPYLAVILGATLGGSSGVFIRLLDLSSTSITFFRVAVPVIFLLFYLKWKKVHLFRGNYKIMLLASSLNAIRIFLYFVAYLYTTMANAVIMLFTWPIFAAIFGIFFLKEKVTKRMFLLLGMAFAGIVVMYLNQETSLGNKDFLGMGAMLVSAIVLSLTFIIYKRELPNYSKMETIFYQNLVGAIIFLPFIFINKPLPSFTQSSVAIIYAFLIGVVGFMFFFYALKRLKIAHYSLMTYWEVPAAIVFGFIFFQEAITWNIVLGGLLIVTAGFLLRKEKT